MTFDELPPDPYLLLGVTKDATLPEIRSAHRKLVLKCHPDKVQDAALKAIKQDEFQKVQEAYELLSDDNRRVQYDEQVKLYALRKEMGRGNPTPRSNPFEYEVKSAEPRTTTYTTHKYAPRPKPMPRETSKVYPQQQRPSSYEDVGFEEPVRHPKKSASYESADRHQKTRSREEDRVRDSRRHEDDERARQKWDKEMKRSAHGEKKKKSDKEKRRGAEEKHSSRAAYVEDDSSDDYRASRSNEKARQEKHRMEEDNKMRNEAAREAEKPRQAPLTPKWDGHKERAHQYMQAARQKVAPSPEEFPRPMQRAETFHHMPEAMKYNIRYAVPPQPAPVVPSDEDVPRRSSAPRSSRRSSETPKSSSKDTPKSSSKEKERDKDRKRSGRSRSREPYIVEPPSPPPPPQKPSLQTHSSAPPNIPGPGSTLRREPSRSKTQDYPRNDIPPVPSIPRAATFQAGDRGTQRGSRLKNNVGMDSDSDSDTPVRTNRHSHSPPPSSRRREAPELTREPTRYIIDNGRSVPIASRGHRSEMRNVDNEMPYLSREHERSESPHGTPSNLRPNERPPIPRTPGSGGSRQAPSRSHSQAHYPPPPEAPEPIVFTARPNGLSREASYNHSRGVPHHSNPIPSGSYFSEVKYATAYRPEDVAYSNTYRRDSDASHHPHAAREYPYTAPPPPRGERVYAA